MTRLSSDHLSMTREEVRRPRHVSRDQIESATWYDVTDERPITSSAATAASRPGTTKPGRPVVSATNITAASGTRYPAPEECRYADDDKERCVEALNGAADDTPGESTPDDQWYEESADASTAQGCGRCHAAQHEHEQHEPSSMLGIERPLDRVVAGAERGSPAATCAAMKRIASTSPARRGTSGCRRCAIVFAFLNVANARAARPAATPSARAPTISWKLKVGSPAIGNKRAVPFTATNAR